ncbi:MAG: hypothetical protein WBA51_10305 [Erythrobacter sp.]
MSTNDASAFELYRNQQVRPSHDEIAGVASKLWSDAILGPVFQRVGLDGDLTDSEHEAVQQFISDQQVGEMRDRRFMDLWLATGLVRRKAASLIEVFDGPEALAFIEDRLVNAPDGQHGIRAVKPSLEEVLGLARALLCEPEIRKIFIERPENGELSEESLNKITDFEVKYRWKHCLGNRAGFSTSNIIASKFLRGIYGSIEDPDIINYLRKYTADDIDWSKGDEE